MGRLAVLLLFLATGLQPGRTAERLNILFLLADDRGRHAGACRRADAKPSLNDVIRPPNVDTAREEGLPCPMRGLRTRDFLYIHNLAPERRPPGDPRSLASACSPSATTLEHDTMVAFADMDSSPTKAWLVAQRDDEGWKTLYQGTLGKRPAEELSDLGKDPGQQRNIAAVPRYEPRSKELAAELQKRLAAGDAPRLSEAPAFEPPPFTDSIRAIRRRKAES